MPVSWGFLNVKGRGGGDKVYLKTRRPQTFHVKKKMKTFSLLNAFFTANAKR